MGVGEGDGDGDGEGDGEAVACGSPACAELREVSKRLIIIALAATITRSNGSRSSFLKRLC
jgi:hypothetical protein